MSLVISLPTPTEEEWKVDSTREIHYTTNGFGWSNLNRSIEPIGKEFELVWSKVQHGGVEIIGLIDSSASADNENTNSDSNEADDIEALKKDYQKNHREWVGDKVDHYRVMGLQDLRWRATDNDIKLAYKKMILVVHPDKNQDLGGNDEAFKALVKSNNILTDIKKRRAFDSTDPFDDDIPSEKEADTEDFYELFGPVFAANSKWSSVQPVPQLGDENTPYDKVMKFYNFWFPFKSWRDFTFSDDHDLDNAESREEKRWMERENEKKRVKQRKIEAQRISDLVNLAHRKDPRIIKKLKEEEEKKNAGRNAKNAAKIKAQQEKEAAEKAEKERIEAEEKKKKDEAEEKKRIKAEQTALLKKGKITFRNICNTFEPLQKIEEIELVISTLDNLQLGDLTAEMESKSTVAEKKACFLVQLNAIQEKQREAERVLQEQRKAALANKKEAKPERPWTEEELHLLAKAIQKYPPGVTKRWESVASCIPTRSLKDVIAKAKSAQPTQSQAFSKPEAAPSGSDYEKLKSKVGEKEIKSELSSRGDFGETTTTTEATATTSTPAATETAKPAATATTVEWTPEEQKLLEEGLQKVDKNAEDRWDQIAAKVGTKSKKDCVARFKYLASVVKNIPAAK